MKGFTLIEVLVSTMIFTIVMVISLGALLSMSESDRKAETLKAVINNLNFSLESMSRNIRTGVYYHCGNSGTLTLPQNCSSGDTYLTFLAADSTMGQVVYCKGTATACDASGTTILRSINGGQLLPITAPEVNISTLKFFVTGAPAGDNIQPKVTILLRGVVQVSASKTSPFNLETSVTQRIYDQ